VEILPLAAKYNRLGLDAVTRIKLRKERRLVGAPACFLAKEEI